MKNLKISTKLYMTLILYSVVFIAVGIYWIITLDNLKKEVDKVVQDRIVTMDRIQSMKEAYNFGILATIDSIQNSSMSNSKVTLLLNEGKSTINSLWTDYSDSDLVEAEFDIVNGGLQDKVDKSLQEISKLIDFIGTESDSIHLSNSINRIIPLTNGIIYELRSLSDVQVKEAQVIMSTANKEYDDTRIRVALIVLIMLIGPGIMAIVMILGIGKSIKQLANALDQMSNGDLKIKFRSYGRDELGGLMVKLEQTSSKLQEVISSVRIAALNMSHASNELSSVSQDVAQGASEQASTSEEIASSVEEIAGNIQQNSINADETNTISERSFEKVKTVSESASSSLNRIVEISEKVSIIGDIAFQTNILSLNAAVEAARAGEHGRGFGVVATEVGKLADRSKNAANEINELSKLTVNVTEKSGGLLEELIPDIEKTSELVKQISASSQEQNLGAGQINIAVQQLSMVTQQNAASSEEMATSAAEMSAQAKQLIQTMSFFSIAEDDVKTNTGVLAENSQRIIAPPEGVKIDLSDNDSLDKDFVEF